jgi:hypothetical protein
LRPFDNAGTGTTAYGLKAHRASECKREWPLSKTSTGRIGSGAVLSAFSDRSVPAAIVIVSGSCLPKVVIAASEMLWGIVLSTRAGSGLSTLVAARQQITACQGRTKQVSWVLTVLLM